MTAVSSATAKVRVREMVVADLPQVMEIERLSFSSPWSQVFFQQELQTPQSRLWVATTDDAQVVGYLCRWHVADEAHILNVAVHPAYRRRGIATLLVEEVKGEAREKRVRSISLEVRQSNVAARNLYRSLGFHEVGMRRHYYGRGEDAIIMMCFLGNRSSPSQ